MSLICSPPTRRLLSYMFLAPVRMSVLYQSHASFLFIDLRVTRNNSVGLGSVIKSRVWIYMRETMTKGLQATTMETTRKQLENIEVL